MSIEDMNYENDGRVRAGRASDWFEKIDRDNKRVLLKVEDEEGEEIVAWFPYHNEVCGTCGGDGTHVNPSIDAGGLTQEDFEEDPGFAEDYRSGRYDVECYECNGNKVVPALDERNLSAEQERILDIQRDNRRLDAEYAAECAAERRAGC